MSTHKLAYPNEPAWNVMNMTALLMELAKNGLRDGQPIISPDDLLKLWEENRVHLLIQHEVPFSIECRHCEDSGSGQPIGSLDDATVEGWTEIEVASPDNPFSHFYGLCPEHTKAKAEGRDQ